MVVVRDRCGYKESFVVPSYGASGGLTLFWNSENKVIITSSSQSYKIGRASCRERVSPRV